MLKNSVRQNCTNGDPSNNKNYTIGSIQVLVERPDVLRGFDYDRDEKCGRPVFSAKFFVFRLIKLKRERPAGKFLAALFGRISHPWITNGNPSKKQKKEWFPVFVEYVNGVRISPCVLTVEGGKQILGKVDVRSERATVAYNGKEHVFVGPNVHPFVVLCRKARPGQKFD
uniref:Uncharacterized protein n=1 Tax=Panagrolaimus davidi TaxID=227884 RepID=A0A914P0X9_9BILA